MCTWADKIVRYPKLRNKAEASNFKSKFFFFYEEVKS